VRIMNSLPDHSQLSDANFMYGLWKSHTYTDPDDGNVCPGVETIQHSSPESRSHTQDLRSENLRATRTKQLLSCRSETACRCHRDDMWTRVVATELTELQIVEMWHVRIRVHSNEIWVPLVKSWREF
jgi:hypothetical protein